MSRLLVEVIVLPLLYAVCKVLEAAQEITWLEPSIQSGVPVLACNPARVKNESVSVVTVTPLVPDGVKVDWPKAVSVLPEATVKLPFTVVVPEALPREIVVAAPP